MQITQAPERTVTTFRKRLNNAVNRLKNFIEVFSWIFQAVPCSACDRKNESGFVREGSVLVYLSLVKLVSGS